MFILLADEFEGANLDVVDTTSAAVDERGVRLSREEVEFRAKQGWLKPIPLDDLAEPYPFDPDSDRIIGRFERVRTCSKHLSASL